MTMYGAPATTWEHASIPELIGDQAAWRLFRQPAFRQLHTDVIKARSVIVKHFPVQPGGWVENALGLRISRKEKPRLKPRFVLAHILQGLEAKALMAVVRQYGDNVQLCVHDGWVTREQIDLNEVTCLIRDAIGIDVEIEETFLRPLPVPVPAAVDAAEVQTTCHPVTECPGEAAADPLPDRAGSSAAWPVEPGAATSAEPVKGSLIVSNSPKWNRPRHYIG